MSHKTKHTTVGTIYLIGNYISILYLIYKGSDQGRNAVFAQRKNIRGMLLNHETL